MKQSIKEGIGFGLTSAVLTTLGLLIGLSSTTQNKTIIIGGILTIAIADAFSDGLGVHISQESDKKKKERHIWRATFSTFFTKIIIGLTFLIPIIFFSLNMAIIVSIVYGLVLLSIFSYYISLFRKESAKKTIFEHLSIALVVIVATRVIGLSINHFFG